MNLTFWTSILIIFVRQLNPLSIPTIRRSNVAKKSTKNSIGYISVSQCIRIFLNANIIQDCLIFIYLKQSHLILLLSATLIGSILFYNGNNFIISDAQGQNPQYQSQNAPMQEAPPLLQSAVAIKITSPSPSQNVSAGNLTIMGTSSDTPTAECQVYADWNDKKPFQRVVAAGPEGNRDYSKWNYTYSSSYHE